jgi:hypothetical protein
VDFLVWVVRGAGICADFWGKRVSVDRTGNNRSGWIRCLGSMISSTFLREVGNKHTFIHRCIDALFPRFLFFLSLFLLSCLERRLHSFQDDFRFLTRSPRCCAASTNSLNLTKPDVSSSFAICQLDFSRTHSISRKEKKAIRNHVRRGRRRL